MKKIISFILAAAMSAVVAVPAFAVDAQTVQDSGANTWTTSGQNDEFKDAMMTMIAYAPGTDGAITVDSIQYIDQTVADDTGAYSFSSYIPKVIPTGETVYQVKVGGETLETAISAGTIDPIEITEVPVTGTITTQSNAASATVSFCTPGTTDAVVSADTAGGAFTANVEPGTYDVVISRDGYLKYTITGVEVSDTLSLPSVTLKPGDTDTNGLVNTDDLTPIIGAFGASSGNTGYAEKYDIDANDIVNTDDLTPVIGNFGETETTVAYEDLN